MRFSAFLLVQLTFVSVAAADAPPEPRRKDVPYSIAVENVAELTEHAIVLYPWHERPGAPWTLGVFTPGGELAVDPDAPDPQMFRVKRAELPGLRIEVEQAKSLDAARTAIKLKGTECGDRLWKHQQVIATSKVTRLRVVYAVDTHLLCERKHVRDESFEPDAGSAPLAGSVAPAGSVTPTAPSASAPASQAAPESRKGCAACAAIRPEQSPWTVVVALTAVGGLLARRRSRHR